jgi:hypothetical protein
VVRGGEYAWSRVCVKPYRAARLLRLFAVDDLCVLPDWTLKLQSRFTDWTLVMLMEQPTIYDNTTADVLRGVLARTLTKQHMHNNNNGTLGALRD